MSIRDVAIASQVAGRFETFAKGEVISVAVLGR